MPELANPQALNRYAYVYNNPLKYTDPTGHFADWIIDVGFIAWDVVDLVREPSWEKAGWLSVDVALGIVPFVPAGAGASARVIKAAAKSVPIKVIGDKLYTGKHFQDLLIDAADGGQTKLGKHFQSGTRAKFVKEHTQGLEIKIQHVIAGSGDSDHKWYLLVKDPAQNFDAVTTIVRDVVADFNAERKGIVITADKLIGGNNPQRIVNFSKRYGNDWVSVNYNITQNEVTSALVDSQPYTWR